MRSKSSKRRGLASHAKGKGKRLIHGYGPANENFPTEHNVGPVQRVPRRVQRYQIKGVEWTMKLLRPKGLINSTKGNKKGKLTWIQCNEYNRY
jgi:hypothetical protein